MSGPIQHDGGAAILRFRSKSGRTEIAVTAAGVSIDVLTGHDVLDGEDVMNLLTAFDDQGHVIEFREGGWTLKHPLACRPRLFECEVNRLAEDAFVSVPGSLGRYEIRAEGGVLHLGDEVKTDG